MGRGAWMGAAALFFVACGGAGGTGNSSGGAQRGAPTTSGAPVDGGTVSPTDAGVVDGGRDDAGTSGADAGTDGGGPADGGIVPDGGIADGGTPSDGGTLPDGGIADGGAPSDGGTLPDGGAPSCWPSPEPPLASCAELMPSEPLGPPLRFLGPTPAPPPGPLCAPGAFSGDLEGFLGVARIITFDPNEGVSRLELDLLAPDGGTFGGPPEATSSSFLLVPLPRGAAVVRLDADAGGTLARMDETGATSELTVGMARSVAAMPGGGMVVAEGGTFKTLDGRLLSSPLRITRRDDSGTTLWSTPIPTSIAPAPSDAQVYPNGAGHVLAVVSLDSFQVRIVWLDAQGQIVSSGDTLGVFSSEAAVTSSLELPDHSLAFGISPAHSTIGWVVVHDLDPRLDVPPCWLGQRPETTVNPIRGGRGWAVFHGPSFEGNARQGLEIVTSNGESCGWVDATCGDPTAGPCDLEAGSVGLDGTLYLNDVSQRTPEQCLVESWPNLLR